MSMCESILTIALVCTVKYLHYCDYYYTLGNDSQSTPKLIAYHFSRRLLLLRLYRKFYTSFQFLKFPYNNNLLFPKDSRGSLQSGEFNLTIS